MSQYDQFRLCLAEQISAVNVAGYVDETGVHHSLAEQNDYYEKLQQYWILQYNEMFDGKNRLETFFTVEK